MGDTHSITSVIIQIDRPGQKLDMPAVREILKGTGIQLDGAYGPILINARLGRFVVRGSADAGARAKAQQLPGVRIFTDARQEPM